MAKAKTQADSNGHKHHMRPALTPEADEQQMIALAMDCARKQLSDGTASSQVITHFLKLATTKAQLEIEKTKAENELLKAKTKSIADEGEYKQLVADAITAFRNYSGQGDPDEY